MPNKFKGENSKAAQARTRKETKHKEEQEAKQKEIEDAFWQDDDKHVKRKQQRKDDKERKQREQLEKKQEKNRLLEEEMASLKTTKPTVKEAKVTRAEIEALREAEAAAHAKKDKDLMHDEMPLEDNINRMLVEGEEARNIEGAIAVLNVKEPELDRHPEKRMKAAFKAYEDVHMPLLKQDHPNLRLSQLKQLLKKEWMKAPENPLNQKLAALNEK